jgi:hypothetical protein
MRGTLLDSRRLRSFSGMALIGLEDPDFADAIEGTTRQKSCLRAVQGKVMNGSGDSNLFRRSAPSLEESLSSTLISRAQLRLCTRPRVCAGSCVTNTDHVTCLSLISTISARRVNAASWRAILI